MNARDFCFWLQGFFELAPAQDEGLDEAQSKSIRAHLALVFKHEIAPIMGPGPHQDALNAIHKQSPWQQDPNGPVARR